MFVCFTFVSSVINLIYKKQLVLLYPNVRLGWRCSIVITRLDYYVVVKITTVMSFIVLAFGVRIYLSLLDLLWISSKGETT